jgi:hypothetical protein
MLVIEMGNGLALGTIVSRTTVWIFGALKVENPTTFTLSFIP